MTLTKLGDLAPGAAVIDDLIALLRAWAADETAAPSASPLLALLEAAQVHGVTGPVCAALARAAPGAAALLAPAAAAREAEARAAFATLTAATAALNAGGIEPVALKGGAVPALLGAPAPMRAMVDVDLLAPPGRMAEAVRALAAAGWRTATGRVFENVRGAYAHPPLLPPGGEGAPLELHARCAYERGGVLAGMWERARPAAVPGLRAPAPEDRLAHLVHQVQAMDRGLARRVARLRDLLDWRAIVAGRGPDGWGGTGEGADVAAVAARFSAAGDGAAFSAFAALAAKVWDEAPPVPVGPAHRAWADEVLAGMADPAAILPFVRADQRRLPLTLLRSPAMVGEYLSRLAVADYRAGTLARAGKLLRRAVLRREV